MFIFEYYKVFALRAEIIRLETHTTSIKITRYSRYKDNNYLVCNY